MSKNSEARELTTAEKIYARKLLTLYAAPIGKLSEKAMSDLTEYNTFFNQEQLKTYLQEGIIRLLPAEEKLKQTPGGVRRTASYAAEIIGKEMLSHEDLCPHIEADGKRLYTSPDLLQAENDIVETAKRMAARQDAHILQMKPDEIVRSFNDFVQEVKGRPLRDADEINEAVSALMKPGNVQILNGPPGAGKSIVCLGVAYGVLSHMETPPHLVATAPSNSAAASLYDGMQFVANAVSEKSKSDCRVSGAPLKDVIKNLQEGKIRTGSVLVVDEAGLMGTRDMASLLKAADKAEAKLILVGDNRQIPPVPAGNGFDLLISYVPEVPQHNMTQITRQERPSEAKASEMIRNGLADKAMDFYAAQTYEDGAKALTFRYNAEHVHQALIEDFVSFTVSEETCSRSSAILAVNEEAAGELNKKVRKSLKEAGVITRTREIKAKDGSRIDLGVGDVVMFNGKAKVYDKHHQKTIEAGTMASVDGFHDGRIDLLLPETDSVVSLKENDADALRQGWVLPLYIAQGISCSRIFLAIDCKGAMDQANGLVAFTRHEQQMSAYVSRQAYEDHKALGAEMKVFSSRKALVKDFAAEKAPEKTNKSMAHVVAQSLTQGRTA